MFSPQIIAIFIFFTGIQQIVLSQTQTGDCFAYTESKQTCPSGYEGTKQLRFFYNQEIFECIALTICVDSTLGQKVTNKTFSSISDCNQCKPQDGPTCAGGSAAFKESNGDGRICENPSKPCPEGYTCINGYPVSVCCNQTVQTHFDGAFSSTCSNGKSAYKVNNGQYDEHVFADNCDTLSNCPQFYKCVQVNVRFAKCCRI